MLTTLSNKTARYLVAAVCFQVANISDLTFQLCGHNDHIFAINPNHEVSLRDDDLLSIIESSYPFVNPAHDGANIEGLAHDILYIGYFATIAEKEERVRPLRVCSLRESILLGVP